ncbi:hypothetical protein G4Y79_02630 [Phototrophicus methaneseepsis]|uniref:Uncharacterized protein n=1 Tax=Phototrophicus methaneseepsis TaxID=2710758 RepID=A0A7S8EAE0_9CHLR|nr:hypothetical protein [Phototrophicus methaneseepsis]QPC83291.1 hypothetical protein G4Y79_02630 [Phototrophicus methaneseepsis]
MLWKFKRAIGLLAFLATLAAIGFGGSYFFTGVMFSSFLWALITGMGTALVASILINWLGFRFLLPRRLLTTLPQKVEEIGLPVVLSTLMIVLFSVSIALGIDVFYYNHNSYIDFAPEALRSAQIASVVLACVMSFLFAIIMDWLGFRVLYKPEENLTQVEKQKRTSRVDDLFASLSDAEIRELRQRLLADEDRLTEDAVYDDERYRDDAWYDERQNPRHKRLQAER